MKKVLVFGAFDPLNEGQKDFLRQAKTLGDYLLVVVAHDSAIRAHKQRDAHLSEAERLAAVKAVPEVDEVMLGREGSNKYHILGELEFDVLALGYNQKPTDEEVREQLNQRGKYKVEIVRLQPFKPDLYPSN